MRSLVISLRSIARLAIKQPVLAIAALLVIALAAGTDTSTFKEIDASIYHAVGDTGPLGKPTLSGEVESSPLASRLAPGLDPVANTDSTLSVPETPLTQPPDGQVKVAVLESRPSSVSSPLPRASSPRSKSQTAIARRGVAPAEGAKLAQDFPPNFPINLGAVRLVKTEPRGNVQRNHSNNDFPVEWNRILPSNGKPVHVSAAVWVSGLSPSETELIADSRSKMARAAIDFAKSNPRAALDWSTKVQTDWETIAHKFIPRPASVRAPRPAASAY